MGYRKLNFALAVLGVLAATAGLIAQTTLLRAYDVRTESLLSSDMQEAVTRLKAMENDYRKKTLQYGFNVRVLPEGQSLADFYDEGYAAKTMDQNYARRLADSEFLTTIRHLAPILRQKITWAERKRKIVLIGTHGEEPLKERKRRKKAIIKTIPEGRIDVGYDLCNSFDLKPGQEVTLLGRKFTIRTCQTERGSQDDISIWVDLQAAQEMTDMAGKINEIQAVDCKCAEASPTKIRQELAKILPGAQVTVKAKPAVARAAIRVIAEQGRVKELTAKKANRLQLRKGRHDLMLVTAPLIIAVAAIWIMLLAFSNVRQRTMEIGVLRAIGLSGGKILSVFIVRSLLIGLIGAIGGAVLGGCLGAAVAAAWGELTDLSQAGALFSPLVLGLVVFCSPVLSAIVSWPPAMSASRQDPAVVLSRE
jgi:ABC-type lipoprotein release transport system permease subunit